MSFFKNTIFFAFFILLAACNNANDNPKNNKVPQKEEQTLRIGVTPTLECLPVFVAQEYGLASANGLSLRPIMFPDRMSCDTALAGKSVEIAFSDLVCTEQMKLRGIPLQYVAATGASWQFIGSRTSRVKEIKHLTDKMIAVDRKAASGMLAAIGTDSAKTKTPVFQIQVGDPNIRLRMLLNNEIDAALLPEPQATTARLAKHNVMMDSRRKQIYPGVVAFRTDNARCKDVAKTNSTFKEIYNQACDSIRKYGVRHYADIIKKYCNTNAATINALPDVAFSHATAPDHADIERAKKFKP